MKKPIPHLFVPNPMKPRECTYCGCREEEHVVALVAISGAIR